MPKPSVRVVIPCFNHGHTVGEAVASACALEDATVEVVVVDDGSDDGTSPAACDATAALGARVLHRPNGGLSAARNTGAAGATTTYLAFLDADDLLLPHFARDLAAAIETDGGADVSHAYGYEQVTGLHDLVWKCPPWDPIRMLLVNLHPVTALVRTSAYEGVGRFDESLRHGHEDWEFWIRCIAHGWRGVRVESPVFVWRRFHEQSLLYQALDAYDDNVDRILTRHAALYREHAIPLLSRALRMLHEADATWLDEDYGMIHVRNRRAWIDKLLHEAEVTRGERDASLAEAQAWQREVERVTATYEAKPAIRLSRRLHALAESLPGPVGRPARGILGALSDLFRDRRSG